MTEQHVTEGSTTFDEVLARVSSVIADLEPDDAPEGIRSVTGHLASSPATAVTLLETEEGPEFDADFIVGVLTDPSASIGEAAENLGPGLAARWESLEPELTFFGGEDWCVRFAEWPKGSELGTLVTLEGLAVTSIDDLADADFED